MGNGLDALIESLGNGKRVAPTVPPRQRALVPCCGSLRPNVLRLIELSEPRSLLRGPANEHVLAAAEEFARAARTPWPTSRLRRSLAHAQETVGVLEALDALDAQRTALLEDEDGHEATETRAVRASPSSQ